MQQGSEQQPQQPPHLGAQPAADDVQALVAEWEALLETSVGIYAERHTHNRKHRLTAVRLEMERVHAALPPDVAQQLTDRLVRLRAAGSKQRKQKLDDARSAGPKVVVDCGFAAEHCRPGLETRSLAKQVEWAMAANKRSAVPLDLHVTGWAGEVATFGAHIGAEGWSALTRHERPLLEVFATQQVVVLSPDAEEPLTRLEPDCVYVVGGIVDRSVRKGVTSDFAEQNRLRCMRLPVFEHAAALGMVQVATKGKVRVVLNVSDVVIALAEFHSSGDWAQALTRAIPARKRRPQEAR